MATKVSPPPVCDNAVRSTLFGSFGILKRYSLLHNYLYRLHQAISTKSTAVLSQDGSLNPAFHLPDPMHTCSAEFQFRPYTAMTHTVCVTLALYKFYFPSCFTLLPFSPKWFTLYWKGLPHSGNIFPASPSPIPRHRFCHASSYHTETHTRHSGDQGLLLAFFGCCGETIDCVEVLFVN